jgi:hypothetical protein
LTGEKLATEIAAKMIRVAMMLSRTSHDGNAETRPPFIMN